MAEAACAEGGPRGLPGTLALGPHRARSLDVTGAGGDAAAVVGALQKVDSALLKSAVVEQLSDVSSLEAQQQALVLHADEVLTTDVALSGGKGSSLAVLNAIEAVEVPLFFCVTTSAFREHFRSSDARGILEELQRCSALASESGKQEDLVALFRQAARLRGHIQNAPFGEETERAIREGYARLCGSEEGVPVAVRSSATTEDTKDASFAGQHDTFLNQRGEQDVLDSVRRCWASIFTDRAVEYRGRNSVRHEDAVMSVVVQVMVDPYVAGTSFSVELSTGFPAIHVAATYGLGEAVVSGEVTSDEWLLDPDLSGDKVVKRVKGSKEYEFIMKPDRSGVEHVPVDEARRSRFCMETDTVLEVARGTRAVQKVYQQIFGYGHVDTEFAVTKAGGVRVLQSRPVVAIDSGGILTVDRHSVATGDNVVKGAYSLLGAVTGRCKIIRDFDDLVRGDVSIRPEDILITAKTSNYWNQYLTNLRGIVTMDGSPTAHPMLIGRERGLPVICGIPGLLQKVGPLDGKRITVDGLTKWMYRGHKKLRQATREEVESQFQVQKPVASKDDAEILSFLGEYHRSRKDKSGNVWVHNPNTPLSPAWCAIRRTIYAARLPLVNAAREIPLLEDPFGPDHCTFPGNIVADKLVPVAQTLSAFQGMSPSECDRYHRVVDEAAQRYLKVCGAFGERPSVAGWRAYLDAYAPLYAALWLSYFWRMHLKTMSSTIAKAAGMSQFHYGQMLADMQERLQPIEEDYVFRRRIVEIADEVRPFVLTSTEQQQLDAEGSVRMSTKSVLALALSSSDARARVDDLAKSFRIAKNTDIALPPPAALVVEKIVDALETGAVAPAAGHTAHVEFFPGNAELQEAVRLHVTSRVQNSNCHHWKWRGQWKVKDGLATVCKALGLEMKELLRKETPDEIEALIQEYELLSPTGKGDTDSPLADGELAALRREMRAMQDALLSGFGALQKEVQAQRVELAALRGENAELRRALGADGAAAGGYPHGQPAGSALQALRSARSAA